MNLSMQSTILSLSLALTCACSGSGSRSRAEESRGFEGGLARSLPAGSAPAGGPREYRKPTQRRAPMTDSEPLFYYDGGVRRPLWPSPDRVAEFEPSAAGERALLASGQLERELPTAQSQVRLWQLVDGADVAGVVRAAQAGVVSGSFSPVLHDGNAAGSPMRALPGGVIVSLDESWSEARVSDWLAANGLRVERELPFETHALLVSSPAGLASLELANRLFELGEVESATPNFWRDAVSR